MNKGFLLLSIIVVSVAASAQTAFDFKGSRLGMTQKEWADGLKHSPVTKHCSAKEPLIPEEESCLATVQETIAGCRVDYISYNFFNKKLYSIYLNFSERCFEDVSTAMRGKYGAGLKTVKTYQNGFGATFSGESTRWANAVSFMLLDQYGSNRETSTLFFYETSLGKQADAARARIVQNKAKDL